ncbi:transglycosylase SLT domain-containing protein [Streptomyces sp. NBC_00257]|uniref:transglycosylase SLT domain-containing protein n=1 Tax=unclassified Streptomyces TaxID=2593676 RepID=UPI00225712AF|nr:MULTISPECIES: transglycosylase SLT domain-containing protein [unclassified Streptomyces]WSW08646.1 transglycosylase SLT domain-containing protein [Streptomyces sp. NBC_01005]WTB53526.1 transglycosylase SLT domain-containing protein [Streptomyces sp. NBC_00826]WTC98153.1 transglycosylase SLT domain-containing protein [Streptomyces sp. NBC_01650]WTH93584.1 transglycosylase SLT domain-containing protein [Streptomyces sp. NBC_00825]WTI02318.1 transglycosylase SLT domain-containing protein [Stre
MSASSIPGRRRRLNKTQKLSVAGISAMAVAALSFSLVPANADPKPEAETPVSAAPVVLASAAGTPQAKAVQASIIEQHSTAEKLVKAADLAKAKKAAAAKAKAAEAAEVKARAEAKAKAKAAAKVRAKAVAAERTAPQAASRSEARTPVYANNLDGWINQALDIMRAKGIPGSYDGLHRNIMRESTGNPNAVNGWDVNAQNGTPSCGLLQVIQPTFNAYHVAGTSSNIYDPVANITAAANYAADKYGSIDNVNSAY